MTNIWSISLSKHFAMQFIHSFRWFLSLYHNSNGPYRHTYTIHTAHCWHRTKLYTFRYRTSTKLRWSELLVKHKMKFITTRWCGRFTFAYIDECVCCGGIQMLICNKQSFANAVWPCGEWLIENWMKMDEKGE